MELQWLDGEFTVCKTNDLSEVKTDDDFCFIGKTDEETSVVCRTESAPRSAWAREDGWTAFHVVGQLDFSLTGILSKIASTLAKEKIPLFALSTFDTDYVLIKRTDEEKAKTALSRAGYIEKR